MAAGLLSNGSETRSAQLLELGVGDRYKISLTGAFPYFALLLCPSIKKNELRVQPIILHAVLIS
jgi:hypothetical protein